MSTVASGDTIRVELFGGPRVHAQRAGPVRLSPLQLALVALVFGHVGDPLRRARAVRLLWDCEPDADARHRIRQLLADIRSRCAGLIETHEDELRAPADVMCDLVQFERALEAGSISEAATLAGRGFADLPLQGLPDAYWDWRAAVHVGLMRRLRGRAAAAWSRGVERTDWTLARDAAEGLYRIDPLSRQVVERVIEARARTGDLELAESAYAAYLESVDSAQDPSNSVHAAIRKVREACESIDAYMTSDFKPPLVGRREALDTALAIFGQIDRGRFGMVLIEGESGIGKTRLLQEVRREAAFREYRCLYAQAVELESRIPLNPLLDALKSVDLGPHLAALGEPWRAVITAVLPPGTLPEPGGELPPIQERALPRRLLDALSLLLQRLSREQPTVLFIDDLHWVDTTTVTALQFMQRRWGGGGFGVVATVRTDLVRREEAVAKYLFQSEGLLTSRIELRELPIADAMRLVRQLGGDRIDEEPRRRICALAGLHPLCLVELTRDYLSGRLTLPDTPDAELVIPMSLEQIVRDRIDQLDPRSRRLAGFLAVGARPVRVRTLAALAEIALDDAADSIEVLRRARLVESDHDRVRIVHELFRSAIYRDLGEPRRSLHHRAIAERLQAEGGDDSVGELAIHYDRAGEGELAAKYGWIAADRAMETGTVAEAGHFYQLVAKNERDAIKRADATGGHARALHLARDISRANPMLELAAFHLRAVGKPADALRLEIKRVEGLAELGTIPINMLTDSLAELKRQASEGADWEAVALALDVELHLLHRAGDVSGIRRVFDEMRAVADRGSLEATILGNAGLALGVLFGDPVEALAAARRAVDLAVDARSHRLTALIRLMVVLQYQGMLQLPESEQIVREARALAERSGDVLLRFSIESNLAVAWLDAGDLERAEVLMGTATTMLGAAVMDISRFNQTNNRAELALAHDDYAGAARLFAEAATYLGPNTPSYMQDLVAAGLGLCSLESGDLGDARRREQDLHDSPDSWHFDPITILTFRVRLLDRRGRHREALELLESSACDLEHRLVLAWFKVRALQVRLMMKRGVPGARAIAHAALMRAESLCLAQRAEEFTTMLRMLDRRGES
jgi:DNA-binding SARP family transcriptional activator